ncbi:HD domain-containing protein [Micromonospora sediminicola]|uniref:HD domain-containing protein n=1 Tax=Micromonospora sediminicola TaxID=946078 RepID=UPI00379384CD
MTVSPTVADADALAAAAHHGQTDKAGRPYIEHPRAVAAILAEQGHGDHAVMAGLLHDVVEDTPISLDDLRAAGFPEAVVSAVDAVSRRDGETYMDMIRRAAADPLGRLVKLADNAHNSSEERLANLDPEAAAFLRRRYAKARAVLLPLPFRAAEPTTKEEP